MPWKRSLIALAAVAGVIALAAVAKTQSPGAQKPSEKPAPASGQGGKPAADPPLVTVEAATERDVQTMHTFVGTVMPKRQSSVGSAVDARVVEFPFNEGDRVEKSDTLAQLLTGQLDIQLKGANADATLAEHELAELEKSVPLEVDQARARMQSREAALKFSKSRLERARTLYSRNTVTADQLEEAVSLADQAAQAYAEAQAALDIAAGPRQAAIDQARAKLEVKREAANAIEDQIKKHTVRSPFNGYVVEEHTEIGQWVARAGLVAKVAELDEVDVEIMVLENLLPNLTVGMPATVEITALGKSFPAHVEMIVPQADARSRSFPVKVRVKNTIGGRIVAEILEAQQQFDDRHGAPADGTPVAGRPQLPKGLPDIKAGMFARVTLEVAKTPHAIVVHKDSVVLGGKKPVVYVVDGSPGQVGTVRMVEVELGVEDANYIQVVGSVAPGDLVIVEGNERVRPQMPVTTKVR